MGRGANQQSNNSGLTAGLRQNNPAAHRDDIADKYEEAVGLRKQPPEALSDDQLSQQIALIQGWGTDFNPGFARRLNTLIREQQDRSLSTN